MRNRGESRRTHRTARSRWQWALGGWLVTLLWLSVFSVPAEAQNGSLIEAPGSPYAFGTGPLSIALGDFNGDGHLDLVTANVASSPPSVSLLLGDGAGGFAQAPGSPFRTFDPNTFSGGASIDPHDIAVGDVNNDGHLDVVTANPSFIQGIAGGVSVLLGDGAGGLAALPNPNPFPFGFRPTSVAVGDFNGDGNADLAITNTVFLSDVFQNEIVIVLGLALDNVVIHILDRELPYPFRGTPRSITVGDFNGDGKADLVMVNPATRDVSVWLGDGTGQFAAAPGSPIPIAGVSLFPTFPTDVAVGDFDEDGHADLAVGNGNFNSMSVLLGDGTGHFAPTPGSPLAISRNASRMAVGDFNGDGHADLAAGFNQDNSVAALLGAGNGTFAAGWGSPYPVGDGPQSVVAADFNGDGRDDLAVASTSSSDVTILVSVADSTAPTITLTTPPNGAMYLPTQVVIADYACQDDAGGTGVASCLGNVAAGARINTSINTSTPAPTMKAFTVTARDNAGNTSTVTHNYGVEPLVFFSPENLSFGNQGVNTTSPLLSATVSNTGAVPVSVDAISILGDFSFATTCPLNGGMLEANGSCTLAVSFTPTTTGNLFGIVLLTLNGIVGRYAVTLDGTGVQDVTAPTITLTTPPEGAVYALNQVVNADYSCQDEADGSGLASCVGDVANGTSIDTATLGARTFAVMATDNAGNTSTVTHDYAVIEPPVFLLMDEDSLDNGISSIENISFNAPFCGAGNPAVCVNDDIANPGVRELLFTRGSDITSYSNLVLPTGQTGDWGLFRFSNPDPQVSLQNGAIFTTSEFIESAGDAADENNLDKIDGVAPLGDAEIRALEGKTVCAVVYDSDISRNSDPPFGSLKGATLGLTAFRVMAINPHPAGGSYLPLITVDLLPSADVQRTCNDARPPT